MPLTRWQKLLHRVRMIRQAVSNQDFPPDARETIQASRAQALRWLNLFHIVAQGSAAPIALLCLKGNYPFYGPLLGGTVLFLLAVYNLLFYSIPAQKRIVRPYACLLKTLNICFGLCWSSLPIIVFPQGDANDRVVVAGLLVGLTSTTITLLPLIGVGEFIATMLIGSCFVALWISWNQNHDLFYVYVGLELAIYLFFVLTLCLTVRLLFTAFLLNRQSLEQRNSIVSLLLRNADDEAGDWLWETTMDGRLQHVSATLASALGQSREQLEQSRLTDILSERSSSHGLSIDEAGLDRLRQCLDHRIFFRDVVIRGDLHGEQRFWSLSGRPIFRNRIFIGYKGVGTDVTRTHEAQESASFRARHDLLTSLPNRAAFLEDMERYLIEAEEKSEPFALLNLDLDGFKQINDRFGHHCGDQMLKKVAITLSHTLEAQQRLYRFGGDEFILLERGASMTEAARTADHLVNLLTQAPIRLSEGMVCPIGLSVGIVVSCGGVERVSSLLEASDLALYEAKSLGGHTFRFYNPELLTVARRNRDLIRALPTALEKGQLDIVYQPFFNAQSQKLCGFEALIRWTHPEYGRVPAERIIQLAEEAGLIHRLGVYVMERACREAHGWGGDLVLSVNVSVGQLEAPAFLEDTFRILRETGLSPTRLQIEMTESIFMEPDAATFSLLHKLQTAGISIALDDFGKGFSSLGYLRFFPFSKIKLDSLFVRDMLREPRAASIVRAVIELAIDLGVAVTAEGVENREQLAYLRRLGCTEIQGYLLSRPLTPEATSHFLKVDHSLLSQT